MKYGDEEGVNKFLRGEPASSGPTRRWREKDGVIYFTVTSDGTTGKEWIEYFENRGVICSDDILLDPLDFEPTSGVTYEIAVLKTTGWQQTSRDLFAEANKRGFTKANAEVACLIHKAFSREEIKIMGFSSIITIHPVYEFIEWFSEWLDRWSYGFFGGKEYIFFMDRMYGRDYFSIIFNHPGRMWGPDDSFAFVVRKTRSKI